MSLLSLILLSTTPLAGLGMLLGLSRFEHYVLDGTKSEMADTALPDEGTEWVRPAAATVKRAA